MNYQKSKQWNLTRTTGVVNINALILIFFGVMTSFGNVAYATHEIGAAHNDPSLEVFRVRCQIDTDINPVTGLQELKVQIQGKARAELLGGLEVGIFVENVTALPAPLPPNAVYATFELGSASADWDTFPDPGSLTPVTVIKGDFVAADETIRITAQVTDTGQTVSETGRCADKTSAQFKQDTKGICKLKDFLRDKCKSGDILPDGTTLP